MSDNDTLFWRLLALFQTLPELQPWGKSLTGWRRSAAIR